MSRGLLGLGFQGTEGRGGGRHRTKVETGVEGGCEWGDQLLCSRLTQVRGETLRRAPIGETGKYGAAVADVAWTA